MFFVTFVQNIFFNSQIFQLSRICISLIRKLPLLLKMFSTRRKFWVPKSVTKWWNESSRINFSKSCPTRGDSSFYMSSDVFWNGLSKNIFTYLGYLCLKCFHQNLQNGPIWSLWSQNIFEYICATFFPRKSVWRWPKVFFYILAT